MLNNPVPKDHEEKPFSFNYPIIETIKLGSPVSYREVSFWEVLKNRRSSQTFNMLTLQQLGDLLWHSAKVKDLFVQDNGYILTHRPSPSAGARHPIDIIISTPILDETKLFYYNPFEHSLNKLNLENDDVINFKVHIDGIVKTNNATTVWFVAHQARTEAKYNNALSLVWRDAGSLIYCLQIVSCAYQLNSCPIGSLGEPYISQMFSKVGQVFGVGGLLIG